MKKDARKELEKKVTVKPGSKVSLKKDFDPAYVLPKMNKKSAEAELRAGVERLAEYQDKMFAQNIYSMLLIFQGMDAAGKDGVIKHVFSGVNPQGCQVFSFKAPSPEEQDHDYLWRCSRALPERGRIGIFNRSYYEEVLVVRVHPEILKNEQLPAETRGPDVWKNRYEEINQFERYLVRNGIIVMKFFLNVSPEEQKRRFLERIEMPSKNWKFALGDVKERSFWKDYQKAFEECLEHTSTEWAPWYVIPADHKYFARLAVMELICDRLEDLKLAYPTVSPQQKAELQKVRGLLLAEKAE